MIPLFAGFEGARLHWNGHDTLIQTRHTPQQDMARHYARAIEQGATGFRDTLPERYSIEDRHACARAEAPNALIVWSAVHFDQPLDAVAHARAIAEVLGPRDRLIAVNEPSIGAGVAGVDQNDAVANAHRMMEAALAVNPELRFWTCDPTHNCSLNTWAATDQLVSAFAKEIEVVGCNYHAAWAGAPLRDILKCAADRYPDHMIALTETSWHEGLPSSAVKFPWVHNRRDWWSHIQEEVEYSGVPLACMTWAPWLNMSWEPGEPWPNGWVNG